MTHFAPLVLTVRILYTKDMNKTEQILSSIPGNPLRGLTKADELWDTYKAAHKVGARPVPSVMTQSPSALASVEYDVAICGGTLGILLGAALVARGWTVALLEQGTLRGRDQEWNISRRELETFIELDRKSVV